jgi:hypothetical protein
MKKSTFLLMCVFVLSLSVFAQSKTNFSGTWELDKASSKLDERQAKSIESQTLTVTQTDKEFTVEVKTKRLPPPEMRDGDKPPTDAGRGQGRGRGGMGGGMDGATTYSLNGKETTMLQESPMGQMPVTLKAKFDKESLKLSRSSTFNGPTGEMTIGNKETWTLSADGKTLTVKRESESPRGSFSSESTYKKATESPKM